MHRHCKNKRKPITKDLIKKIIAEEVQKTNSQLSSYKHSRRYTVRDEEFQKTTTQKIKRFANALKESTAEEVES